MKNLFLTIILFASFFLYSCTNTSKPITEEEVRSTILNMFDSFSVESDNMENFKNFVDTAEKDSSGIQNGIIFLKADFILPI